MSVKVTQSPVPRHRSLPMTRLIHEQFSILMTYALSRTATASFMDQLTGDQKHLRFALYDLAEERANRALLELALYVRLVDDDEEQQLSEFYKEHGFGEVEKSDGTRQVLTLRALANKVIHAERHEWLVEDAYDPVVRCYASKDQASRFGWMSATIHFLPLAAFCGMLAS